MTWNIHDLRPKREPRAPLRHAARAAETRAPHHNDGPRSVFDDDAWMDEDDQTQKLTLTEQREMHMQGLLTEKEWQIVGCFMRRGITEL